MAALTTTKTALSQYRDRWDLIADREFGIPELGWAIAAANPDLITYLVLPAGITLNIPDVATLRRPLTAANPAREDDGEFLPLPEDDTPAPIPTGGGGVVGDFVPLSAVGVTVAPLFNNLVPIGYLPAYPTLASLGAIAADQLGVTVAPLVNGIVPGGNLPAFPSLADLGGVSFTTYTAGINGRIATSARSAANGVAPLGADSLVPASFLPAYPTLSSLGALAASARSAANGVAPLGADSLVILSFLPAYPTLASLGGLAASSRNAANGVAGLDGSGLLAIAQFPLSNFFAFTGGASFRAGGVPAITTTLTQAGVTAEGLPIYWFVNASATAGNRLKSIVVSTNGNIQIRHHADDGTVGNIFEHTASGNILTNGTIRPGSGNTAFTGAQFVPGSTYFRTDLLGDSGVGCATYSDGSIWRRVSDGTATTEAAKLSKTVSGTTAATQGATTSFAHGLNGAKITGVTGVIFYATGQTVPINGRQPNYASYWATDTANFSLTMETNNSGGILSKPYTVTIHYTT